MAEKLTPQQEMAVKNRGGRLLVSAAAGSGKTKVLVDRLMQYLLDPEHPANLDEFLIITYTKAAASELRGKIAAKLTQYMAQMPENRHLQRQMQRLYLTKISTVHSFCTDILREYAYLIDLPGDFRVADENECRQLQEDVMQKLLEDAYDHAEDDPDFCAFVDAQGLGRDDRLVPDILLKVYESSVCHLDPAGWRKECEENADVSHITDAGETVWGKFLMEDLFAYTKLQLEAIRNCARAAQASDGMEKPALLLETTVQQLEALLGSHTWDDVIRNKNIDYGRMVISKKCPDQDLAERIKAVRNACKKGMERKLRAFTDDSSRILSDMAGTAASVRGVTALAGRFADAYAAVKRSRRVLDFSDLEHRTLDLLMGKRRSGATAAAREIGSRFREVMVDEYQDSNGVQDAIFSVLTEEKQNCFMVGDVKQSIYQFRLADPGIFLEKYSRYKDAESAEAGEGRKIFLSRNFRSGGDVLKSVNDIFELCMSPSVGGLRYGPQEALYEGIPHRPVGEPEVEFWGVDVKESTYDEEAAFVASRIAQLTDGTHFIRDGEELRPIAPEDVAILLRSPGSSGQYYMDALAAHGIRCASGGGEDLLKTREISALRAILQTVSNPRQDIPLIAALASPVFGFTADDLSALRSENRHGSVYDALCAWQMPKAKAFLEVLAALRREARLQTLAQLIEKIYLLTGMDSIYAAMDQGDIRAENLQTIYQLAAGFESTGRRDLEQFLEYLDGMEEKGLIAADAQSVSGAVTLTSIHKSKGLEYPVVIVAGLSKIFNRESLRAQVLCDQNLGIGLSCVNGHDRVRYPTLAKRAISVKMASDSLSEELRVLYVALTRARDRLIMTYASNSLETDISELAQRMDMSRPELLSSDVVCPGQWVLMAALKRTEAGALFALGGRPVTTEPGEPVWMIKTVEAEALPQARNVDEKAVISEAEIQQLREGLSFRYPHMAATAAPSKQTATQRKGRDKDREAAESAPEDRTEKRTWRKPAFGAFAAGGKEYGTATHAVMQYINFSKCGSEPEIREEITRLVTEKFLTREQADMVNPGEIAAFFTTEIGKRCIAGKQVLREFKFSILDDGKNFDPALEGEQILLQGVVDCALIEPEGITVIDFKTDRVWGEELEKRGEFYRPQVQAYADALARIYGMPVRETLLYFFRCGKFVSV